MAIAVKPELHAEAKRVCAALCSFAKAPAGTGGVMRVITKRFALYPQPQRGEAEWAAWWSAYTDALGDLPEQALEIAMQTYVKEPDAEFLPKPGRIRELARQAVTPAAVAAERATAAAAFRWIDPRGIADDSPPIRPSRSPEEIEQDRRIVHEMALECAQMLKDTADKRRPQPYRFHTAPVDGGGLTREMRQWMASQASPFSHPDRIDSGRR